MINSQSILPSYRLSHLIWCWRRMIILFRFTPPVDVPTNPLRTPPQNVGNSMVSIWKCDILLVSGDSVRSFCRISLVILPSFHPSIPSALNVCQSIRTVTEWFPSRSWIVIALKAKWDKRDSVPASSTDNVNDPISLGLFPSVAGSAVAHKSFSSLRV